VSVYNDFELYVTVRASCVLVMVIQNPKVEGMVIQDDGKDNCKLKKKKALLVGNKINTRKALTNQKINM